MAASRLVYGAGSQEVLDQVMAVAWGLNDRGEYREADSLLTGALAAYRAAGGAESQALSDALDILATAKKRLDQPAAAESLYRQSLAMQVRLTGANDTITASRLSDLGSLLSAQDRLAAAESAVTAAQLHRRGVLAPLDVKFLVGESNLAMIEMKRGDLAAAAPRLRTAVSGLEQVDVGGGLNLARTLDRMALFRSMEFHDSAAVATSRRASEMFRSVMGAGHPETLNSLSLLASYQAARGDRGPAISNATAAYGGLQRRVGERHELALNAGQRLAFIRLQAGNGHEAAIVAKPVMVYVREKYGRIPPSFARLLAAGAGARAADGDASGADSLYRAALAALAGGTRVDSAAYPAIVAEYCAFLVSHGRAQTAQAELRPALAFIPASADSGTLVRARLRTQLARSLAAPHQ